MERRNTILPPPPGLFTAFRAALGAFWFRATTACHGAARAPVRARLAVVAIAVSEPGTPIMSCNALAAPSSADRITREDDRWLRPTEILPLRG